MRDRIHTLSLRIVVMSYLDDTFSLLVSNIICLLAL